MVIDMHLKPSMVEMQHSCPLGLVSQKKLCPNPSQQLPTAVFADRILIVAVLTLGSGCCLVKSVHAEGYCFCFVEVEPTGEGWGPFSFPVYQEHVVGMLCFLRRGIKGKE